MNPSALTTDVDADLRPRWVLATGAAMVAMVALLLCLLPEENRDFFWQLRTGNDILLTHHAPHADTFSWPCKGTTWYVPEWLTFALFALAFQGGAFFGTWMLKVVLAIAFAMVVWFSLVRRIRPLCALILTVTMLLAMRSFIQERPYMVTYLLLAVSLVIIETARARRANRMLWLPVICAAWANLHQGAVVLPAVLLAYATGDGVSALWLRIQRREDPGNDRAETSSAPTISLGCVNESTRAIPGSEASVEERGSADYARRALRTAGIAAACFLTSMISPYGIGLYKNIYSIVADPTVMKMVIEWSSINMFSPVTFLGFYILVALIALSYLGTHASRDLGGIFALLGLLIEALLHVRNVPIFAVAGTLIAAQHVDSTAHASTSRLRERISLRMPRVARFAVLVVLSGLFLAVLAHQSFNQLQQEVGTAGYSPEEIGEAVIGLDWFPVKACQFVAAEQFPPHLRLYNDFGIGGYLIYTLPSEPVFMDGRNDIYSEHILRDYLEVRDVAHPDRQSAVISQYSLDYVITSNNALGASLAQRPDWAVVYADSSDASPRYFILLRNRPEYADLIARCQRDCPALQGLR